MKRFATILALVMISSQLVLAQTFSVQGVLRDPLGKTVADDSYSMTFRIYDVATGGTALWFETQGSVNILHGVYNVELGTVTSLENLPFDTQYWMGLSVEGGVELAPRFKLTKAPSALSVLGTNNVFPSRGNIGVGTITPTAGLHIVADATVTNDILIEDKSGNPKFVVNDDSHVGVGVATPTAALHIKPESDTNNKLLIEASDGSDILVITGDGKMGVGVGDPNHPLAINGNLRLRNGGAIVFDDGTSIASAEFGGAASAVASPGNALVTADAKNVGTGEVQLVTGTTPRLVVANDGNVSIAGYTMLGSGSPKIKMKKFTGTLASATSYLIPHGLIANKIISYTVSVWEDGKMISPEAASGPLQVLGFETAPLGGDVTFQEDGYNWVISGNGSIINYSAHTGSRCFADNGARLALTDGTKFNISSSWMRTGGGEYTTYIEGYRDGSKIYSTTMALNGTYQLVSLGWSNIDEFSAACYQTNALIDDISYSIIALQGDYYYSFIMTDTHFEFGNINANLFGSPYKVFLILEE